MIFSRFTLLFSLSFFYVLCYGQFQTYNCQKIETKVVIDGRIDSLWKKATWSNNFVDISTKVQPVYDTRMKMLWDDEALYILAELKEDHVWGKITIHDKIIYNDNDFEVFIKPKPNDDEYFEIEVNALNTTLDLMMTKPYRLGGNALINWEAVGLETAVFIDGTLNNSGDLDRAWYVEMRIPFASLSFYANSIVPKEGDFWRMNFSRVQWQHELKDGNYSRKKDKNNRRLPEDNWVWSKQNIINMHLPERWGFVFFTNENKKYEIPLVEKQKLKAWKLLDSQLNKYRSKKEKTKSLQLLSEMKDWRTEEIYDKDFMIIKLYPPEVNYYFVMNEQGQLKVKNYE